MERVVGMSTLRKDPVSSGWVIIAEGRETRPKDLASESARPSKLESCPFCGGKESETPPEIAAFRKEGTKPDTPGWSVRAIANKYAALHIEGDLDRRGEGIYDLMNGIGAHEVIVETPEHDAHMAYYPREKMKEIIWMYIRRYRDLFGDDRFRYIQVFRNYGAGAGASLEHPHSQLIALPITPRWVKEELNCALAYYRLKERCLFCDIVRQETHDRQRVVFENDSFVTIEPFASKFPFETWLAGAAANAFRNRRVPERPAAEFHHPLGAAPHRVRFARYRYYGRDGLPLAHRDLPAPDPHGGIRVGHGFLHQPHAAREGSGSSAAHLRCLFITGPAQGAKVSQTVQRWLQLETVSTGHSRAAPHGFIICGKPKPLPSPAARESCKSNQPLRGSQRQ